MKGYSPGKACINCAFLARKHEIWYRGTLGGKKHFKPQTHFRNTCLCILQTRTPPRQEKKFFSLQNMSYYISLEGIFHADSKKHHNIYLKMDWERVLAQRSNLQTRTAAQRKNNVFLSKHVILSISPYTIYIVG